MVKCHDRRGKFNPTAAKALGVDRTDFKLLAAGQTITTASGSVVRPDMVLGDPLPGSGIIIADIPSVEYLSPFLNRPELDNESLMANMTLIYWILGPGLASHPDLASFIASHPSIQHHLCSTDTCPNMVTHPGAAAVQVKLRVVDPRRFPLCTYDNKVPYPSPPGTPPSASAARDQPRR
ncbi:tRNA processing endoribonuclease Trz1 [Ophiocordyceps camponoti-floridani]|uniref:tRNA processing endoribonuclease Trz1 n=1 Tax=Ophiocordyceps camponoti-floridani TaxID=2030778 RepID=A0A8H4VAH8_9HYPO|nr:tRNA processing endoribonuclease Trz1 [Ophiocordyceps camponoti-floridani]